MQLTNEKIFAHKKSIKYFYQLYKFYRNFFQSEKNIFL